MPVPTQLLLSHPEVKLPVLPIRAVSLCAAEPRFYRCPDATGPVDARALLPCLHSLSSCHKPCCGSSGLWKTPMARDDVWTTRAGLCMFVYLRKPLFANMSVEGTVGGWDDAGQRMLMCKCVLLPQLEKESEGSCQQQTHLSCARTCQWHGIMEAVCWKLKGFSRTFVNDIKEGHVADVLVYN